MENISTVLKYCCGECGFSAALTDSDYCIELYQAFWMMTISLPLLGIEQWINTDGTYSTPISRCSPPIFLARKEMRSRSQPCSQAVLKIWNVKESGCTSYVLGHLWCGSQLLALASWHTANPIHTRWRLRVDPPNQRPSDNPSAIILRNSRLFCTTWNYGMSEKGNLPVWAHDLYNPPESIANAREQKEAKEDCQLALNDLDAKWRHLYLPLRLEHWGTGWLISSGAYSSLYFPSKIRQLLDFVLTVVLTITLSINIPHNANIHHA